MNRKNTGQLLIGRCQVAAEEVGQCPWLAQGIVTFETTNRHETESDATGLSRGRSRSSPVTFVIRATNVRIHGTSPWHSGFFALAVISSERKDPRDEPVAFAIVSAVSLKSRTSFPETLPLSIGQSITVAFESSDHAPS